MFMHYSERGEFIKLMIKVGANYDKAVGSALMGVYWRILKDFELIEVRRAFKAHCRHPDEGRFFPKPADIVRWLEGSPDSRAMMAWSFVESCTERVGRYQSVVFDDPLIHAVIEDMGGWIKLCEQPLSEMHFMASNFQKRYRAFLSYPPKRHPAYLVGLMERENATQGYAFEPPLFLGDQSKAELVFKNGGGSPLEIHTASGSVRALIKELRAVEENLDKPKKIKGFFKKKESDHE
jgi:Domain of unknown function (DUF6475)